MATFFPLIHLFPLFETATTSSGSSPWHSFNYFYVCSLKAREKWGPWMPALLIYHLHGWKRVHRSIIVHALPVSWALSESVELTKRLPVTFFSSLHLCRKNCAVPSLHCLSWQEKQQMYVLMESGGLEKEVYVLRFCICFCEMWVHEPGGRSIVRMICCFMMSRMSAPWRWSAGVQGSGYRGVWFGPVWETWEGSPSCTKVSIFIISSGSWVMIISCIASWSKSLCPVEIGEREHDNIRAERSLMYQYTVRPPTYSQN
jgi:hypothetical protein